ncbi:MAG: molybdopterin-dependent oxidoreductase, partial [Proteobacteria bacterium]|nr:molybdopterin-dependent oxidoreductase [Pseudomonadota bacterium]
DHVFEDVFFYAGNPHLAIEQHSSLAAVDPNGKLTLWSSTQIPHYLHNTLAKTLELPATQIRVVACPNGGAFGGKSDPFNHEIVVCKAAPVLGRPVTISLSREEVFYCHRGRHPVLMKFRTGVTRDGKLTGMHLQTLLDGGAYGSYGIATSFYTAVLQTTTYHLPRYRFDTCRTFTNKPPCGPKRGHGAPQARFGQEVQLDKIAEKLKMDPAELRLGIVEQPGSLTANYLKIGSNGLVQCIQSVVERSDWKKKFRKLPNGHGLGLACSAYITGAGSAIYRNKMPHTGVQLQLDRSGRVSVFCGATEIGQGSDDVLTAIIAEELGIDPLSIRCVTGDTDFTPVDLGSYSSRVTLMMGNAAIEAAGRARDLIASAVAAQLKLAPDRLVFSDCRVFDVEDPDRGMSFQEAVVCAEEMHGTLGSTGSYIPPKQHGRYPGATMGAAPAYSFSAAVIEVKVDESTGWISIPRIYVAHDIGRALNPTLLHGQIVGSVYMGLSEALMEEQAYQRLAPKLSGALMLKNSSMLAYKSLTSHDMPEVLVDIIGEPDANGPYGAKEGGQGSLLPIPPALANAVYDAVGVRIDEVPITPDKILRALEAKHKGLEPRVGPAGFPDVPSLEPWMILPPWEGGDGTAMNEPEYVRAAKRAAKMKVAAS